MVGPAPATGTLGVGLGVGLGPGVGDGPNVGVGDGPGVLVGVASGTSVGVGPGVLVGVGPGVPVGVGVGVGPGVPVRVGVGVLGVMVNTSLQFVLTAWGVACGTVGATDCSVSRRVLVRYATTPIPTVRIVTSNRYQYFFRKDICFLLPHAVYEYF